MYRLRYLSKSYIVIWLKPNGVYYYKLTNYGFKYHVGYVNSYGHQVVLLLDVFHEFIYREKFSKMVLKKFISFLQKILNKM